LNCPIKLIREAAIKTPDVISPMEKVIHYDPAEIGSKSGTCWLCGCKTDQGFPQSKTIKDTFQNKDMAKAPWSDTCCEHCNWALSFMSMRNYSIIADGTGLKHPSRIKLREALLNPPEPPFVICCAESGQLWLHFKAKVNLFKDKFWIRMDKIDVMICPIIFNQILETIEDLYKTFSKAEIESGNYQSHRIKEFGLEKWEKNENQIKGLRKSGIFQLALFVAHREDKDDNE
jgi:CRISPR type IV-associated protein Csf1